jgi:hypothetical protein
MKKCAVMRCQNTVPQEDVYCDKCWKIIAKMKIKIDTSIKIKENLSYHLCLSYKDRYKGRGCAKCLDAVQVFCAFNKESIKRLKEHREEKGNFTSI